MRTAFASAVLLLAISPLLDGTSRADEPTPEKSKVALQGKWIPTEQFTNGKAVAKGEWVQAAWEFKGDRVTIHLADFKGRAQAPVSYNLSLDPTKSPAHLDLTGSNPKIGFIAVYKLEKDTLTICWNPGRETRPKGFETSDKDFAWMLVLRREK
jgi:uncharacterized protein (TIGR03067 family)